MTQNTSLQPDWDEFYKVTLNSPPHAHVLQALELLDAAAFPIGAAVDLGCGAGRDTRELLKRGWRVLAIDKEQSALDFLRAHTPPEYLAQLETRASSFEALTIAPNSADLLNASYALSFCKPEFFGQVWQTITNAIKVDGWFVGNVFGVRDQWSATTDMTFLTLEQFHDYLKPFQIAYFHEQDAIGATACGGDKHWHVFTVIAKRK